MLAWFARTSWAKRQALKWITAGSAALAAWMLAHGGSSEQSTATTAGMVAVFTFFYEQFVSWLCSKSKIAPPFHIGPAADADADDADELEGSPPARGLEGVSPFAPASGFSRPSIFTQPTPSMLHHPDRAIPDGEPIQPMPRLTIPASRALPLGPKGCVVLAEPKADPDAEGAMPKQIRGILRCEADDGTLVILDTPVGIQSLERAKYHFYPRAEE